MFPLFYVSTFPKTILPLPVGWKQLCAWAIIGTSHLGVESFYIIGGVLSTQ